MILPTFTTWLIAGALVVALRWPSIQQNVRLSMEMEGHDPRDTKFMASLVVLLVLLWPLAFDANFDDDDL